MIGAILAAVWQAAVWVAKGASIWALAARTAIMVGASYLLNQALQNSSSDGENADTHVWSPQTTEGQGGAIQASYGTNRVHANIVGHYLVIGAANTIVANSAVTRVVLACFGAGPIEQPDEDTLRINDRPFSDFTGVTTDWRLGTVDQTALDDWTTFRQDYNVGESLEYNKPVTQTLPWTGYDEIEVHLKFPNGLIHYGTDGDKHSEPVSLKIEMGDAVADTWQTIFNGEVSGETAQAAWLKFVSSGTYTGGSPLTITSTMQPRVRVTLTSTISTNSRHIRDVEFISVQARRNVAFRHPGMVLLSLGLLPTESIANGISELSVVTTGQIVADGSGGFGTSRYHADAIRDILTQPVIEGAGTETDPWTASHYRGVDPSRLTGAGWSAQKTLADTLVPDGLGNNVEMLRCDVVCDHETSVYDAIDAVGASGRCGLAYIGRDFGLWTDSPRTPVGLLCDGNCERGSISMVPIPHGNLAGEVAISFRDANASWADRSLSLVDPEASNLLTKVSLDLAAATRRHEVARLGRRELARNRLVDTSGGCRCDIDAAVYEAGDVVYCQIDGRSQGGRIVSASATGVVLDRPVTELVTADDVVVVQVRNPSTGVQSLEQQAATVASDGLTLTIAGSWTQQPSSGDVFLFGPADLLTDDQFEITDIRFDERMHADISFLRYAAALDDLDALAPGIPIPAAAMDRVSRYAGVRTSPLEASTLDLATTTPKTAFEWGNYTFTGDGSSKIMWSADDDEAGEACGYVRYLGTTYTPADNASGTTATWVYWDPAHPTAFSTTSDPAALAGKFVVAKNNAGTPIVGFGATDLSAITLDNIQEGTTYKRMTAAQIAAVEDAITSDFAQPSGGWEGGFTNNSPSAGYVAWGSFSVRYQGASYTVAAGNTNAKYLYWNAGATKTQLYASSSLSDAMGTGKFIVGINDSGTFSPSQFCKVLNGALIVASSISADQIAVDDLSALSATLTNSLDASRKLRMSNSGIECSTDGGSTWTKVVALDSGAIVIYGDKVKALSIESASLANGAATSFKEAYTSGAASFGTGSYTVIQTASSFVSYGGLVRINAQAELKLDSAGTVQCRIRRGTTTIYSANRGATTSYGVEYFQFLDQPGAGTYTYTLEVQGAVAEGDAQRRLISVEEHRK